MSFPPRFLDELRACLSLADVVGRRVKLVRRGREFIGLCPFHKEKTPSFNVVEDKGFYHCFGCGVHGDVIGFTMQMESLSFPEAVTALAAQANLEVPAPSREERERAVRLASVEDAVEAASRFFAQALATPEGREARAYLERRGLDEATIGRFKLGYAPDQRDALKRALIKDFPEPLLIEAGLLRRPEGGGDSFDYFRGRVIFPIGNRGGRTIAFGGRVLGEGQPKYLNSPDTPLFEKGRVLYGWAAARAIDLPDLDITLIGIPTKANPLGVKGSGQAGAIGAPQTVISAILNALAPLGVTHIDMPATPERVWQAIQKAKTPA